MLLTHWYIRSTKKELLLYSTRQRENHISGVVHDMFFKTCEAREHFEVGDIGLTSTPRVQCISNKIADNTSDFRILSLVDVRRHRRECKSESVWASNPHDGWRYSKKDGLLIQGELSSYPSHCNALLGFS